MKNHDLSLYISWNLVIIYFYIFLTRMAKRSPKIQQFLIFYLYKKMWILTHTCKNMVEWFKYYKLWIRNLAIFKWETLNYTCINIEREFFIKLLSLHLADQYLFSLFSLFPFPSLSRSPSFSLSIDYDIRNANHDQNVIISGTNYHMPS